jgi:hypothetical protein
VGTCYVAILLIVLGLSDASHAQSGTTTIKNVPFSANEWITKTSPGATGTPNVTTQQIAIARTSDGVVRREIHEASAGTVRVTGTPILLVSIFNQDTKTISAIFQEKVAVTATDVSRLQNVPKASTAKNAAAKTANSSASVETTSLNGLQAFLYRSQYSVPASDPNAKANTFTSELWYSPELHVTLKSSISDSTGARTVSVLDDIHRQEPDSSLFRLSTETKTTQK